MSSTARSWPKRYALVDCNSFYCSCERLFRPDLRGRPVLVLSNNDGCIISLSSEAKALKIKMGAPYFQMRELIEKHSVATFSSNYPLYGDISRRVMKTLEDFTPDLTVYSIDEAFLDASHVPPGEEEEAWGSGMRDRIWKEVGIPVTVGIAPTKVLAKIANRQAKKRGLKSMALCAREDITEVLRELPCGEIWGVGRQLAEKLAARHIHTALEFREHPNDLLIRSLLTVTGERIRDELRGIDCVEQTDLAEKKMIASTRSFGRRVFDRRELEEAVSTYVSFACEKLRRQKSVAGGVMVSLQIKRPGEEHSSYEALQALMPIATADTAQFTRAAIQLVRQLFKHGQPYKKAGVYLFDIGTDSQIQRDLFAVPEDPKRGQLMEAMDRINRRWGRSTIKLASCGTQQDWRMLSKHRSGKTQLAWDDLVEVKREKGE